MVENGFLHTSCVKVGRIDNQFGMYIKMRGGIGINRRLYYRKKASEIISDSWNYHNIVGWLPYLFVVYFIISIIFK